jgi:hypothetical protein
VLEHLLHHPHLVTMLKSGKMMQRIKIPLKSP